MRILGLALSGYILGMITWYTSAIFGYYNDWVWAYYWWDKLFGASVFAWLTIYFCLDKMRKRIVLPLVLFLIVRFVWDIISYFTGVSVNNEWGVAALFLALIGVISYYAFKQFQKIKRYL